MLQICMMSISLQARSILISSREFLYKIPHSLQIQVYWIIFLMFLRPKLNLAKISKLDVKEIVELSMVDTKLQSVENRKA